MNCLDLLSQYDSFDFKLFAEINRRCGSTLGDASLRKKIQEYLKNGDIVRVGRGWYSVSTKEHIGYSYEYSELSCSVAETLKDNHPCLDFTIFELVQLNEFVNHQIAHNVIFVFVDDEVTDFVFDTLREAYPGKVLLSPTAEIYHQYWSDNMIVICRLITEAPKGISAAWHTRLEKMLVDLLAESLIIESVSENEYPTIFSDAFEKYIIDESCLFRYAKRRHAFEKIKSLLDDKTNVVLRTKGALL